MAGWTLLSNELYNNDSFIRFFVERKLMFNLSAEKIAMLNEFGEAEAFASWYHWAPPEFVKQFKVEVKRIGSVVVIAIPDFGLMLNRIIGLGVGVPATEMMLDDAVAVLQQAGCKQYVVQISPSAEPVQLIDWLHTRGFTTNLNFAKLLRASQPIPPMPTGFRVESIGNENAAVFTDVVMAAYKMPLELRPLIHCVVGKPGWHPYVGFDGEQPVSAAVLFVSGEIGWFGFACTVETHRKRGGQAALSVRRIQDGLALGCKWFITETAEGTPEKPNSSFNNMLRSGFNLASLCPIYIYQPPTK